MKSVENQVKFRVKMKTVKQLLIGATVWGQVTGQIEFPVEDRIDEQIIFIQQDELFGIISRIG